MIGSQLELFAPPPSEEETRLHKYWLMKLQWWIEDGYRYRRSQHTTGWSMARQGHRFAIFLRAANQITEQQYNRYMRYAARLERIDQRGELK